MLLNRDPSMGTQSDRLFIELPTIRRASPMLEGAGSRERYLASGEPGDAGRRASGWEEGILCRLGKRDITMRRQSDLV